MRATKVLLIESARNTGVSFVIPLKRKYDLQVAHSGKEGVALAAATRPDVVVLDAVSMRTSGDRVCARLRDTLGTLPIIHIRPKDSPKGESRADVVLQPPFTSRKLINRIERFVAASEQGEVLDVGIFSLNLEQHLLITPKFEKKLTPKLVDLMAMFMSHPNQTLGRKDIMQTVWDTDYMGDTRTLDVHIRWLRKIVEADPRKPEYITTVRGQGYCLVIRDETAAESLPEPATPDSVTVAANAAPGALSGGDGSPAVETLDESAAGDKPGLKVNRARSTKTKVPGSTD